jgi:hypothetical protein
MRLVRVASCDGRRVQVTRHRQDIGQGVIGQVGIAVEGIRHPTHQVAVGQVRNVPHVRRLLRLGRPERLRVRQRIARGIEGHTTNIAPWVRHIRLRDQSSAVHRVRELVGAAVGQGLPSHSAVCQVPHIGQIDNLPCVRDRFDQGVLRALRVIRVGRDATAGIRDGMEALGIIRIADRAPQIVADLRHRAGRRIVGELDPATIRRRDPVDEFPM